MRIDRVLDTYTPSGAGAGGGGRAAGAKGAAGIAVPSQVPGVAGICAAVSAAATGPPGASASVTACAVPALAAIPSGRPSNIQAHAAGSDTDMLMMFAPACSSARARTLVGDAVDALSAAAAVAATAAPEAPEPAWMTTLAAMAPCAVRSGAADTLIAEKDTFAIAAMAWAKTGRTAAKPAAVMPLREKLASTVTAPTVAATAAVWLLAAMPKETACDKRTTSSRAGLIPPNTMLVSGT